MAELLAAWERINWRTEIRKDWPSPFDHSAKRNHGFSIFIDNLNEFEMVNCQEAENLRKTCSEFMAACDVLYAGHGSLDSPKEPLNREDSLTSLGVLTCGVRGRRDAPDGCLE